MVIQVTSDEVLIFEVEEDGDTKVSDFQESLVTWVFEDINFRVTSFCKEDPDIDCFRDIVKQSLENEDTLLGSLVIHAMLEPPEEEGGGERWERFTTEEIMVLSYSWNNDPEIFKVWLMRDQGHDLDKADQVYKWEASEEVDRIWEYSGASRETREYLEREGLEFDEDKMVPPSDEHIGEYNGDQYTYRD